MSDFIKKNVIPIIIGIIIIIVLIFIYQIFNREETYNHLKNYKANEYIPTYVSDEDMAKIYLNEYLNLARYNIEESYNLLDDEYKNKKFSSLEDYQNYVSKFVTMNIKVDKYSKQSNNGYIIYTIYDNYGNTFIFKTNGVMQYSVYLDDYTVEIG